MEQSRQTIPYKSKIAYELVFLEAIKDARAQRVNDPSGSFINAVIALELVLFSKEKDLTDKYKLDYDNYDEQIKVIEKDILDIKDPMLQSKTRLNKYKVLSWPIYCKELDRLYKLGYLEDRDFDGVADKADLLILKFESLLEKIIQVLRDGDWLIKGSEITAGGGGHGLDGYKTGSKDADKAQ